MSFIRDNLIPVFVKSFESKDDTSEERFRVICSSVCCKILGGLYISLVKDKEIDPIENIAMDKKVLYWKVARLFNNKPIELIEAAKSAYILELVTSTF